MSKVLSRQEVIDQAAILEFAYLQALHLAIISGNVYAIVHWRIYLIALDKWVIDQLDTFVS